MRLELIPLFGDATYLVFQQLYNSYLTLNSRCDYIFEKTSWDYHVVMMENLCIIMYNNVPLFRVDNGASLPVL